MEKLCKVIKCCFFCDFLSFSAVLYTENKKGMFFMKKRITALMLLSAMLGTTGISAAAETPMEAILKSVKERIGNTDGYINFNSNTYDNENGVSYSFSWQKREDKYERLYVNCTQNGTITSYSDDGAERADYGVKFIQSRISKEEAVKKAQQLADKLNPSLKGELIVETPEVYDGYDFYVKRIKNGLEVKNDGGSITLDKNAEKITNYDVSVTENTEFLPADNLIAKDEAMKKYGEKLGMELEYKYKYDYNRKTHKDERKLYLQYTAKNDDKISAIDGETVTPAKEIIMYRYAAGSMADAKNEMASDSGFSEAETAEIEAVNGLLAKDEIIKLAKDNVGIDSKLEVNSFSLIKDSYYSDVPIEYTARIDFGAKDGETAGFANVSINAKTGEILSFYKSGTPKDEKNKLSDEKLKAAAEETAKKFAGAKFNEYKQDGNGENGYFTYVRYVNGVKFDNDSMYVNVNTTTGEAEEYRINYTNTAFPSTDGIMDKSEAEKSLFSQVEYETVYIKSEDKKMVPVYDFTDDKPLCTDAKTGELIRNGEVYKSQIYRYNDIDNHYAKKEIEVLAELGNGFEGDSFRPDEAITQKDFLTLLFGRYTDDVYERLDIEKAGVAKNESAPITKEEAAKILVYNLGNGMYELAQEDIFKAPFADVTENIGFAAILKGKKIVNGDENGMFMPKENITRANAAIMIYRYFISNGHN